MFDALADNWGWIVAVETALLILLFIRPSLKWELLHRSTDVKYTAGRPGKIWVGKLGRQPKGVTARFSMDGHAANVRLVDSRGFRRMKAGKRYAYVGGHFQVSPVDLVVPWPGRWYGVADLGGRPGHLRGTWTTITGKLPKGTTGNDMHTGLTTIKKLPSDTVDERDVFISYAGADKEAVSQPLADALKSMDISVWMDTFELRIGHSLRGEIDRGIASSRFGVVVLSPAFFNGPWPLHELGAFFARQIEGQFILPIWHQITKEEVLRKSPLLADKIASSTGQYTITEIAEQIAEVVRPKPLVEAEEAEA
ncbi:DUF1883 domain-containing protein [Kibdelosporangium aridum]|uniref:TIR domain-containing protein n=1 Tax=Kibdelosporangium aridum TaxID=2030 RepID=A0A1W2FFC4_KIBAR|nr:DUF1883 domain-containing protein [Kibdelosporangium aridum]SMD20346.1 protein of unknown function [Kibdelosporangium aridum]